MTLDDVYRKVGRGGAGNFFSKSTADAQAEVRFISHLLIELSYVSFTHLLISKINPIRYHPLTKTSFTDRKRSRSPKTKLRTDRKSVV